MPNDPNDNDNNPEALEQQIQEASKKLNIDIDVLREITPEEIQYLLDRCPFLQIVGPSVELEPEKVKVIQSESGWDIHDYGDAMSSSPGRLLMGGGNFRIYFGDEDEGGSGSPGGEVINPGKGTIVNQAFITASEMVLMAKERGWNHISIIDGHDIMKRAAWIAASKKGITVDGFEPTEADESIRKRVLGSGETVKAFQEVVKEPTKHKPSK